tara:strand:- start:2918 stop:5206 length:2289 start_codon:yes stop_codon:yes gene_type:complete
MFGFRPGLFDRYGFSREAFEAAVPEGAVEEVRANLLEETAEEREDALSGYFNALRNASTRYSGYTDHDARRQSERALQTDLLLNLHRSGAYDAFKPFDYDLSDPDLDIDVGEFTFDKTLADFRGPEGNWLYGDITDENLKNFQEELLPVMAKAVAKEQLTLPSGLTLDPNVFTDEGVPWSEALIGAIANNPEVQQIYQKYGVSPTRTDAEGSQYLYDPFSFQEIRTVDLSSDWRDTARALGLSLVGGALLAPIAGGIATGLGAKGAVNTALTGALKGAGASAVAGGDPLTGFLTGGLSSTIDPIISGADLGTFGTAGAEGLSAAGIAEITGGDPLTAGLVGAGVSLLGDTVAKLREEGTTVAEEIGVELPEDVVDSIENKIGEAIDFTSGGKISEIVDDLTPTYEVLDKIIEDVGIDTFNAMSNLDVYNYLQEAGDITGSNILGIDPSAYQRTVGFFQRDPGLRADLVLEAPATTGTSFAPDIFGGTETTVVPFDPSTSTTVNVDVSNIRDPRVSLAEIQSGGGGGGAPATDVTAPVMTSTFEPTSVPSMTVPSITPVVQPPTLTSPGSVTSALLTNTLATLASTTTPTTEPQPTVAPPVTPVATTAPTTEPTPVTTTEPTDIFEDTAVDDTTAQLEAAEAAKDAAETAREAAEAQAQVDAAAADARYGEAVAAGEALGEARYGEGRGQGAGAGLGAGLGMGLLAGMAGTGTGGGVGTGFTPKDFEDYKFRKTYEAPELVERLKTIQGYQAPVSLNLFRGFI